MADCEMDQNDTLQHLVNSLNFEDSYESRASWEAGAAQSSNSFAGPSRHAQTSSLPLLPSTTAAEQSTRAARSGSAGSVRRLSAMSPHALSPPSSRRAAWFEDEGSSPRVAVPRQVAAAEKDVDDPTTPVDARTTPETRYNTPAALTRLLAAEMGPRSPDQSRHGSYIRPHARAAARSAETETTTLPEHLYTRGFLAGRHSDVTILAFGQRYPLHRLILDRAPFFMNGLSEPWVESSAKEVPLHPEEMDSNITKTSFELALKKLYGVDISSDEDEEAIGLFATGCWLEMQDLIDSAVESILRQMAAENLATLITLVTSNYYGKPGERILASARAMLARDGSEMPLKYWDNVPAEVVKHAVGGDGFFVSGEWDRWVLAKRLLNRRLKRKAAELGITDPLCVPRPQAPADKTLMTVRFDATHRRAFKPDVTPMSDELQRWCSLYTDPEVEPLLGLLEEGIYFVHLEFEQLMFIRQSRDAFGLPVVSDRLVTDAQWMQLELRSKVLSARETDLELGIALPVNVQLDSQHTEDTAAQNLSLPQPPRQSLSSASSQPRKGKGKDTETATSPSLASAATAREQIDWHTLQGAAAVSSEESRRFYIPSRNCSIVVGGNSDPVITVPPTTHRPTLGDAADTIETSTMPPSRDTPATLGEDNSQGVAPPRPQKYSQYPPFRFSAEFPNPRLLKGRKRVYSRTVFYAGSLWNVYIKKERSAKGLQLGVYLHRTKEREAEEGVISGIGAATQPSYLMNGLHSSSPYLQTRSDSVDEQIGQLEREMLLRGERREQYRGIGPMRSRSVHSQTLGLDATRTDPAGETSGSADEGLPASPVSNSARLASFGRQRTRQTSASSDAGAFGVGAARHGSWAFSEVPSFVTLSSSDSEEDGEAAGDDFFHAFSTIPPPEQSSGSTNHGTSLLQPVYGPRKLVLRSASGQTATPGPAAIARDRRERERERKGEGRPMMSRRPTLPPYVDARPTIRTWFKIYSPSRGGRLLSVYESEPEQFNFSESQGWKSSSLMLDEGSHTLGPSNTDQPMAGSLGAVADGDLDEMGALGSERFAGTGLAGNGGSRRWKPRGEGRLRMMVVIGNL